MEVREGYKQTEVGMIPEDWNVVHLSELGKFKNGINKSSEAFGHGSPFVNLMDVFGVSSIASSDTLGLVDSNNAEQQTYDLRKGDVIFIRSSVKPSGVGLTAVIAEDLPKTVYSGFLIRFRDSGALGNGFKQHCFYQEGFRKRVIGASSVSANTNINQDNLKKLLIPLPPTKAEQTAIASALSDADAIIQSLEKLIAKKRNIKQGAMQDLLTGKKRLPGFERKKGYKQTELGAIPEDWEVKRLGELFEITSSKRVFQSEWKTEGIPFYRARELAVLSEKGYIKNELFISKEMYDGFKNSYGVPQIGDMLVTGVGTLGKVYVVSDDNQFYFKDGNIIWFKISSKVSPDFLSQLFLTRLIIKQIVDASAGTTVGTYTISGAKKTTIPFPNIAEQIVIARVLSDMDVEISALETKLAKYKQIKQGMMQELLTGRIRLV